MKFLPPGYNTKELEIKQSNKWRWAWLSECDSKGDKWGIWLLKPDIAGSAYCECCCKTLKYGSGGKKDIKKHAEDVNHIKNKRTVQTNQVLPGSSKATPKTESMQDRVTSVRAITSAFISEHCLPFSIAEDLLGLAKRLSEDKQALEKATLSKTSATYLTTHGLAKSFKDELKLKLKGQQISLNLDEATNNNNDKVLNVLVQFYDHEENKIELRHLGTRMQNKSSAKDIFESLESILQEYEIQWCQVLSALMDNCSTMRGVRNGVEKLIRDKNPCLLDISGDSVHMLNNVSKTLLMNLDNNVQLFCSDLFYDIEESPKVKHIFQEVQEFMNISVTKHLIRPISSRFLQMKDVTTRVVSMLDSLTVYYYSFLSEQEQAKYRSIISQIYLEHKVSDEAQASIILLQMAQEKQPKSVTSNDRKDRILDNMFFRRREMEIKLNVFRGLTETFSGYVKMFQCETPLIHTLHSRMVDLTREFLGMFIKPEFIPESISQLVKLDVSDRKLQKADKDLGVGKFACVGLNKSRLDKKNQYWVDKLYTNLRSGYVLSAKKMLQMPLANNTLRRLSVIHPDFVGHQQAETSIQRLAANVSVFAADQTLMGQLADESVRYNVDREVKGLAASYDDKEPIDTGFWGKVFKLESFNGPRYPTLKILVSSLLTIFSGPLVESSFNIMDDIVEKDRARLTVTNYEAVAIVKTTLRKKKIKSITMKVDSRMKQFCINAYRTYQQHLTSKKAQKKQEMDNKLRVSVSLLKAEKAKKVAKLVRLKQRILNKPNKRPCEQNNSCQKKQWKRIKLSQ